jgi:hypothetical protein
MGVGRSGHCIRLHYLGAERWTDRHGLPKEMIWLDIKWSLGIDTPRPPELVDIVTDRPVTFAMGCDPERDEDKVLDGKGNDSRLFRFECKSNAVHEVTPDQALQPRQVRGIPAEYLFFLQDSGEKEANGRMQNCPRPEISASHFTGGSQAAGGQRQLV